MNIDADYDDSADYGLPSLKYNQSIVDRVQKLYSTLYKGKRPIDLSEISTLVDIIWINASRSRRSRKSRIAEDVYKLYIFTEVANSIIQRYPKVTS